MNERHRNAGGTAIITAALIAFWVLLEGYREIPYRDIAGNPTVCSGHTGPDVIMGKSWTRSQCEAVTLKDLTKFGMAVLRCVRYFELSRNQFDSLVVFAGNVGEYAFCESKLVRLLNEGKPAEAQREFERWIWAGGKPILINRRAAELARFRKPDEPMTVATVQTIFTSNDAILRALGLPLR